MKKLLLLFLFLYVPIFSQDTKSESSSKKLEIGTTVYGYNIAFAGFDIDLNYHFWNKGINTLGFKTSLMTMIPASTTQVLPPYILFGGLFELQYSLVTKGFHFALETGLGVASELPQLEIFEASKGFYKDYAGIPYGMFSLGMRIGYEFKVPFRLDAFIGYRMQFPYNLTVKYAIIYGISLSYAFDLGGKK